MVITIMFMVVETGTRQAGILSQHQIAVMQCRRTILMALWNAVHAISRFQFIMAAPSQGLIAAVRIRILLKLISVPQGIAEAGKGSLEAVNSTIQDSSNAAILPVTVANLILRLETVKWVIQDSSSAAVPPGTAAILVNTQANLNLNLMIMRYMRLLLKLDVKNMINRQAGSQACWPLDVDANLPLLHQLWHRLPFGFSTVVYVSRYMTTYMKHFLIS